MAKHIDRRGAWSRESIHRDNQRFEAKSAARIEIDYECPTHCDHGVLAGSSCADCAQMPHGSDDESGWPFVTGGS